MSSYDIKHFFIKIIYRFFCWITFNRFVVIRSLPPFTSTEYAIKQIDMAILSIGESGPLYPTTVMLFLNILNSEFIGESFGLDMKPNERVKYFERVRYVANELAKRTDLQKRYKMLIVNQQSDIEMHKLAEQIEHIEKHAAPAVLSHF